jgi:hypothetical protein
MSKLHQNVCYNFGHSNQVKNWGKINGAMSIGMMTLCPTTFVQDEALVLLTL